MNPLKSPLRNALVATAGALLGAAGAVAVATPASAHESFLVPQSACVTPNGDWTVSWKLTSNQADIEGHVSEVVIKKPAQGSTITGIVENAIEGIFQTSPAGRYLSANRALARAGPGSSRRCGLAGWCLAAAA